MRYFLVLSFLGFQIGCLALGLGKVPPSVVIDKENGADSQGKAWHSQMLKGKVHTLLYMDPDKREESMLLLKALQKMSHSASSYQTVAIINLAATWMPNAVLQSLLAKKQKELKNMMYIFDKKKFLVSKWHLKDDASNVLILDKQSRVIYQKSGRLSAKDVAVILKKIEEAL